jgi:hypothetical protein
LLFAGVPKHRLRTNDKEINDILSREILRTQTGVA